MQLTTIRYIVTVAKVGSFTKAAEMLFISQPALSQAIRRFEQEIHTDIFVRKKGSLTLTPAGELIVAIGEKMLALEDSFNQQLYQITESRRKTLTVGAATSYQRFFLTPVLSEIQKRAPGTHIVIKEGYTAQLCEQVLDHKLDFALVFESIPKNLDFLPVLKEEIFLAVPAGHPLNEKFSGVVEPGERYPIADLSLCRDEEFIVYQPGRRIQQILMDTTQAAGFLPKVSTVCVSTESANLMVYHGAGLAFVPAVTACLCDPTMHPRYYRLQKKRPVPHHRHHQPAGQEADARAVPAHLHPAGALQEHPQHHRQRAQSRLIPIA